MVENIVMLRTRLRREGRLQDYLLRQVELRKQHPSDVVYVRLEEEFGPGSFWRLRMAAWDALLQRVNPEKRADQFVNFEWAKSHLNEKPDGVEPGDVPSRAAIVLLLWALESPDSRCRFGKLHRSAAAAESRRLNRAAEVEAENEWYWAGFDAWHAKNIAKEVGEIQARRGPVPLTVEDAEAIRYFEEEHYNRIGSDAIGESRGRATIDISKEATNA